MSLCHNGERIQVLSADPIDDFRLRIRLSDSRTGVFDVSPYLDKGVFTELRDPQYFRRVKAAFGGVMWPNEQDFSPETIEYELQEIS
jgi:hypothetical protein